MKSIEIINEKKIKTINEKLLRISILENLKLKKDLMISQKF